MGCMQRISGCRLDVDRYLTRSLLSLAVPRKRARRRCHDRPQGVRYGRPRGASDDIAVVGGLARRADRRWRNLCGRIRGYERLDATRRPIWFRESASRASCIQRLSASEILLCEPDTRRVVIVGPDGHVVWELGNLNYPWRAIYVHQRTRLAQPRRSINDRRSPQTSHRRSTALADSSPPIGDPHNDHRSTNKA
jgi:hypothetical protein